MNGSTPLERDLTAWLSETAMPQTPDYADDILDQTVRIRQRPRWTFLRRWLPIPELHVEAPGSSRSVLTGAALLVVLVLILAAVAAFIGSRRSLPPPFGLAGAGLLVVSDGGDIVTVDHKTLVTRSVVTHAALDRDVHWSPDGTRLAFIREADDGQRVVVTDAAGRTLATSPSYPDIDPDSLTWAPNGRQIAITPEGSRPEVVLIDTATGVARRVPVDYGGLEVHWRPPDGRQLLFRTAASPGRMAVVSIEDGSVVLVPSPARSTDRVRPLDWTPDGRRVLYQYDEGSDAGHTIVVDLETGAETRLDVTFAHISNAGTRVAGVDRDGRFCVVGITGGPCDAIAPSVELDGTRGTGVSWSPDDRWIAVGESPVWLVDTTGSVAPRVISNGGPASWQRVLP
jgi:hypothetical protein